MKTLAAILLLVLSALLAPACLVPAESEPAAEDGEAMALVGPPPTTCFVGPNPGHPASDGRCCIGCLHKTPVGWVCEDGNTTTFCGRLGGACFSCVPQNPHLGCEFGLCVGSQTCQGAIYQFNTPCPGRPSWLCKNGGLCCPPPGVAGTCI